MKHQLSFSSYKDLIDYYKKNAINDYLFTNESGLVTAHNSLLHLQGLGSLEPYENENYAAIIVNDVAIERFHPNNIDNKDFWTYAKTQFPLFSVCGAQTENIEDCNKATLELPKMFGFLEIIDNLINQELIFNSKKLNFFEIGYGHGNIFDLLNNRVNYVGIDFFKIEKLNIFKNLLTIEKSGIPLHIENGSQDIVYVVNVLQHCSQHDRFQYLKEGYEKLRDGGYFFGSCFIYTEDNKDSHVWGLKDKNGKVYCNFFNQLTEVDTMEEFRNKIQDIGFQIETWSIVAVNTLHFVLKK